MQMTPRYEQSANGQTATSAQLNSGQPAINLLSKYNLGWTSKPLRLS